MWGPDSDDDLSGETSSGSGAGAIFVPRRWPLFSSGCYDLPVMKRTRLVIALLVAVPMLAASAQTGAVVLCFGSDGHVSVEAADILSRCAESSHEEASESAHGTGCAACGPCNDIELSIQAATLAGLSKKLTEPAPIILSEPVFSKPLTRIATLTPTLPLASPTVVPLRTTVLLL
jgi:hypothetical protein